MCTHPCELSFAVVLKIVCLCGCSLWRAMTARVAAHFYWSFSKTVCHSCAERGGIVPRSRQQEITSVSGIAGCQRVSSLGRWRATRRFHEQPSTPARRKQKLRSNHAAQRKGRRQRLSTVPNTLELRVAQINVVARILKILNVLRRLEFRIAHIGVPSAALAGGDMRLRGPRLGEEAAQRFGVGGTHGNERTCLPGLM